MAIMERYHWSWTDLLNTPNDLVEEIAARLTAERHWTSERDRRDKQMADAQAALARH